MEPPTIAWICQVVLLSTGAPILYILYVWLYPKLRRSYVTRRVTIPGPTPDPFSGNIGDVIAFGGLHEAMRKWSEEYGEVYRMWMGFEPFIVITDPVLTKQVLMSSSYRGPVVDRLERVWGGHNLFTLQPPVWNQHAKLLRPAFSVHVIKDLVPIFSRYSLKMMECWERDGLVTPLSALASESDNSHSHRASEHTPSGNVIEFNVIEWLTRMSLDIIGVTSFGHNFRCLDGDGGEIMAAFDTMLQATVDSFSETVPWYQVWETAKEEKRRRALGVLFNAVKTVLNEKRKGQAEPQASSEADDDHHAKSDNLMDILMATTDEDTSRGLTDEQIQCEVMAFLTGHDTTAGTLTFLLYCLAINPDVQRKVQTEIDAQFERCFAEGRTSLSWDDLKRLTYTHAAIKESQRLYPVAAIVQRGLVEDMELGGYWVPAGTMIATPPYATHMNPRLFKNPNEYRPERFLKTSDGEPEYAAAGGFSFFPYGGGPRMCMGFRFVETGIAMVVANVLRRYTVNRVPTRPPLETQYKFSLQPKNKVLRLYFTSRSADKS